MPVTGEQFCMEDEHSIRVTYYTRKLLREVAQKHPELGWGADDIEKMTAAARYHDVGKAKIPEEILLKPGKLTDEEFATIKKHSAMGSEMISNGEVSIEGTSKNMAYRAARWHHEKIDGSGYPDGLKEDELPLWIQVISIADVYDALTSKRSYKDAFSPEKALSMIANGECGAFSNELLEVLKESVGMQ